LVNNGGHAMVELAKLRNPQYIKLRQYFLDNGYLPIDIFNPLINDMGLGRTYTDDLMPDKIVGKEEVDFWIKQILAGSTRGVKMIGPCGIGKTTTFAYMVRELLSRSNGRIKPGHFRYIEMEEIITLIMDRTRHEELDKIMYAHILIVDELYQGRISDQVKGKFHSFFNGRYKNPNYITWIASNLDESQLAKIAPPIFSRLCDQKRFFQGYIPDAGDKRMSTVLGIRPFGNLDGFLTPECWERWFYHNYELEYMKYLETKGGGRVDSPDERES